MAKLRETPAPSAEAINLRIELIPRTHINLWKDNPRKNDRAAVDLALLIRVNGVRSPVNLWRRTMTAYKGNTTIKAMDLIHKEGPLDGDHPAIAFLTKGPSAFPVPCLLHDFRSEQEAIAYGLSDNKASELAEWNDDILAQIMSSKAMKPHLAATGFKEKEIASILWNPTGVNETEETDAGMSARIAVFQVPPTNKEEILGILREWAANSGFEGLVIK